MKKVLFVLFAVLLAVVVSGCSSSSQKPASATDSAAKQETERSGVITVEKAEMRKGPGKEFDSPGLFTFGEKVRVIQPKGGWTEVEKEDRQKVWVNNKYLAEVVYGKDKFRPEAVIYQPRPDSGRKRLSISRARRMLRHTIFARRKICPCLPHGEITRR